MLSDINGVLGNWSCRPRCDKYTPRTFERAAVRWTADATADLFFQSGDVGKTARSTHENMLDTSAACDTIKAPYLLEQELYHHDVGVVQIAQTPGAYHTVETSYTLFLSSLWTWFLSDKIAHPADVSLVVYIYIQRR